MNQKAKKSFLLGCFLLVLFILFTLSLTWVDRQPIGPHGSYVAYAKLNRTIHEWFGTNMSLYHITDWAGVVAILVAFGFAVLGLVQWIRRKSILKVDSSLLLLGAFYVIVFGTYVFFEFCHINFRPILINGILESSYPSSTTMLAACVLPTAIMQFRRLIRNRKIQNATNTFFGLLTVFMVGGRSFCGVHWFTDILGGLLFSTAMIFLYYSATQFTR